MTEQIPNPNRTVPISSGKMVRFTPNLPVEVALQCTDGVRVEGRYGDRVKYTLTDDRTMYVDPYVAERIKELDVQPGELFQVCKCQAKKGNRKTIYWLVRRDGDPGSQLEKDLIESLNRARALRVTTSPTLLADPEAPTAPMPPEPPPNAFYELDSSQVHSGMPHANPDGNGSGRVPAYRSPKDNSTPALPGTQLAHALKTAISAAVDAETFAKTLDYNIRFTTDDIRSMGITVLIGMQQRLPR